MSFSGNVAQFLSSASTLSATSYAISDTSANIASNLDSLQANVFKILSITNLTTSSPLSISYSQYLNDSSTLVKINNYTLTVNNVPINQISNLKTNNKIQNYYGISVSDTGANISSNIDTLQTNYYSISKISQTDSSQLSISRTQFFNDSLALSLISTPYTINVTNASALDVASIVVNTNVTSISVNDSSGNIATYINSLETNVKKILSITQSSVSTINITASQYTSDQDVLNKISGTYSLNVSAVPVSSLSSIFSNNKVNALSVIDSESNIVGNLDTLQTYLSKITGITQTSPAYTEIPVTYSQFQKDIGVVLLLKSNYGIDVTDVSISNLNSVLKNSSNLLVSAKVTDTSANILKNLDFLQSNTGTPGTSIVYGITISDNLPLTITSSQATSDQTILSFISSGGGTYTVTYTGQYSNYKITPLYAGKNNTFSGFTIKDNIGSTGTSTINATAPYLSFNSGQTIVSLQNKTGTLVNLSNDANLIVIDQTANATLYAGTGNDTIFGGTSDIIYGSTGTTTAAFLAPISNFTITPFYYGTNNALVAYSIKDNVGNLGSTLVDNRVNYLNFGGIGNGTTSVALNITTKDLASTLNNPNITSVVIKDTSANLSSNLDILQSNISKISAIAISDNIPLNITPNQSNADTAALNLITQDGGKYFVNGYVDIPSGMKPTLGSVVSKGNQVIPISSLFNLPASSQNPTYIDLTIIDRVEYPNGITPVFGLFSGNGLNFYILTHDILSFLNSQPTSAGYDGIIFTYQPSSGRYLNTNYGVYLDQINYYTSPTQFDNSEISLFATSNLSYLTNVLENPNTYYYLDPVYLGPFAGSSQLGYIGSVDIITRTDLNGPFSSQATPNSIISIANSFIGKVWNIDGCWVLANNISALAGASLPVNTVVTVSYPLGNQEWIAVFSNSNATSNTTLTTIENMLQPGDMVELPYHITTIFSGSGANAMTMDNFTTPTNSNLINPTNVILGNNVSIDYEFNHNGATPNTITIYRLDTPTVHILNTKNTLQAGASCSISNLIYCDDANGAGTKTITYYSVYLNTASGTQNDSLSLNGKTLNATSSSSAAVISSLDLPNLIIKSNGTLSGNDNISIAGYNGSYWGDYSTLSISVTPKANHSNILGNGISDILLLNAYSGTLALWENGFGQATQTLGTFADLNWQIAGTGNFILDGKSSAILQNMSTGDIALWKNGYGSNYQILGKNTDPNFKIVGTGDFVGDGQSDILWFNSNTGVLATWVDGTINTIQTLGTLGSGWYVAGTGDFFGDGKADILLRNSSSGLLTLWEEVGNTLTSKNIGVVSDNNWQIVGTGDFVGDGKCDILWFNSSTGAINLWVDGDGTNPTYLGTASNQNQKIIATGDYIGDGKSDILWRNTTTGVVSIWIDGSSSNIQVIGTVTDGSWKIF